MTNRRQLCCGRGQSLKCRGQALAAVSQKVVVETLPVLVKPWNCHSIENLFGFPNSGLELVDCRGNGMGGSTGRPKHDSV